MSNHPKAEKESLDYVYYLVGTLSGLFVGVTINISIIWILVAGLLGFLSAAAFLNVLAKGGEKA